MEAEPESPEQRSQRLALEATTARIGRMIGPLFPPGTGFLMVAFDFGGKGSMAYVANGDREGVIAMLGELRDKLRRQ